MKKKAINLPQMQGSLKRVMFAFLFFSAWAIPNTNAVNTSEKGELTKEQILQDNNQILVKGTVTDTNGEALIGVSVKVKGATVGTVTDFDGNFSVNVSNSNATLVFTYMGYHAVEQALGGNTTLNIKMKEDTQVLGEVVVTALGIKKDAKKLGYSIANITSDEMVKTGASNIGSALYGKAAGVRIQSAPGGNTSAVSINIRGLNSITGTNQPLVIVDGMPIRNGDANKDGFWTDQRINSNGLVDINPEDIESMSILKGAAASALYGSEAANGVVMITTKTAKKGDGLGIDFSMNHNMNTVAYMPKTQKTFGPGGPQWGLAEDHEWYVGEGWIDTDYTNGVGRTLQRPRYESNGNFGPRYDGREVMYWDGSVRNYNASDNSWNDLFRTGFSSTYNLAISQATDKGSARFSYTYNDTKSNQYNSDNQKHNFSLTGSFNVHPKLKIDYTASYMRQSVHNRPYRMSRVTNNFAGMFTTFDDVKLMREKTITSLGYLNIRPQDNNGRTPTPDESLLYNLGTYDLMQSYYWPVMMNNRDETLNRLIGSITPTFQIIEGLSLRGRMATDISADKIEDKNTTERPNAYTPKPTEKNSGMYGLTNKRYEIYYGDVLLMYTKEFNDKWGVTANIGYQGRIEQSYRAKNETNGGLTIENWFHLNASKWNTWDTSDPKKIPMYKSEFLKQALLGAFGVSYNNFLFLDGTVRQEKVSTLPKGKNSFFYPSVSGSVLLTEAFKNNIPSWLEYGKVRASYGIVGNEPALYEAHMAYNQASIGGFIYLQHPEELGNINIKPEKKYEMEFGLEGKMLKNRFGFELTYYNNKIENQILKTDVPWTSGAAKILENVGTLENRGFEISMYGTPIQTKDIRWELRGNISFNKNKLKELAPGIDELTHKNVDNGAIRLVSRPGQSIGDWYAYQPKKDASGKTIVDANGFYAIDRDEYVKVGNVQPKATGGVGTTFTYKDFSLDATVDFRIGGHVMNTPYQYLMGRGSLEESMPYRDAANGGLSYYIKRTGKDGEIKTNIASASAGPNGERLYDDGMILPGVKADGTPNDVIISSAYYYNQVYNWGNSGYVDYTRSLFKNTFVKLRELSIAYNIPRATASKVGCKNLSVSIYGRNLFYFYKNMPSFDAEATDGTSWESQAELGGATATTRSFGVSLRASF